MALLVFFLLSQINAEYDYGYRILHTNAETPKICQLKDGRVLALSSVYNEQKTEMSKFESNSEPIYQKFQISKGYTTSAQIAESKDDSKTESEYYLIHHNKQDKSGSDSHEYVTKLKDNENNPTYKIIKNGIYKEASIISLKSGKVLLIGVNPITTLGAETRVEISIYNPNSNTFENNAVSFSAYDNLISCFEQKENHVYCAYVSTWNLFVNKLALKHLKIENDVVNIVEDLEIIKNFYTAFNFVKAIPFNEKEALILFQTGNVALTENMFGNSGKDLYFYHYSTYEKNVLRYEYLFDGCTYDKNSENANADIIALSPKRIFAVCEFGNSLKGFSIVVDEKHIDRFKIKDFNSKSFKNPVFAIFDKTLSLFFTQEKTDSSPQVIYSMLNYPNCIDYNDKDKNPILLPIRYEKYKNVSFVKNLLMGNPYPDRRGTEAIQVRFKTLPINLFIKTEKVLLNKDYDSETEFLLYSETKEGLYEVEFTASRMDEHDGLIIGGTCKIAFNTPHCLDQCHSCNQTGNDAVHFCNGCYNESYYIRNEIKYYGEEFDKLHNCYRCNESCFSCDGPLILSTTRNTTNCKKCYYKDGYFPYENDETLCISEDTQDYWETILDFGIYLDKPDKFDNTTWIWRNCHYNCRKCHEKGNDEDNKCEFCRDKFYFYCDQVEGNGIPGSCHNDCVNNGFYAIKKEKDRMKCCPCLSHCQKCTNDTMCNFCFKDYFLTLDSKECVEHCDYCQAEIEEELKCVNCKTRNQYTLNKTCVPDLYPDNISHHIIDDQCNLLISCKDGCYKCDPWYSDKCTECNSSYYKEDFFGENPQPKTFHCFDKPTCQGINDYPHDKEVRVGGVPVTENGTKNLLKL